MAEHVAPRLRTVFRELARGITVHEIDQMWQDEGFAPGEGSTYSGVRMSRWSDYEASVDWTNWAHVTRVLRVYEEALPAGDSASEDRARIALQLDRNGYLLTNDGRIEPASHHGAGARRPQMSRRITEITRHRIREIHDRGCPDFWWSGKLEEHEFLARIYPLRDLPSTDDRVRDAEEDIRRHRLANYDWPDDWIFTDPRFELEDGHDHRLLRFLAEMLHPVVRPDPATVRAMLTALNEALAPDGYELFEQTSISGRPIYSYRDRNGFHQNAAVLKSNRPRLNDPRVLHEQGFFKFLKGSVGG